MTTFAPALHLQNDNIHTKIKAQMIIKDPGSSITHFIGMLCAIAGLFPLILKAASYGTTVSVVSMTVFMVSMILLYAASTTYHTFDISSNVNIVLKRGHVACNAGEDDLLGTVSGDEHLSGGGGVGLAHACTADHHLLACQRAPVVLHAAIGLHGVVFQFCTQLIDFIGHCAHNSDNHIDVLSPGQKCLPRAARETLLSYIRR